MKQFKINSKIEAEVEAMFILGKQAGDLRRKYPKAWALIKSQFELSDYSGSDHPQEDIENFKIALYAEVVRQNDMTKKKKEKAIKDKLKT